MKYAIVKNLREEKGLTQEMLSKITGISQNHISAIEVGTRRPSIESAKKLGAALGFDWPKLFD